MKLIGDSLCGSIRCILTKISENMANHGQNWNIKEKRFCFFTHFELLAKSLWCPEQ